MFARIWNSQRCILVVLHLICVVSLVNCSPSNLNDTLRLPPPVDNNNQVGATIQSIRKDAELAAKHDETNVEDNLTQESFMISSRQNDDVNGANEQSSITNRLDDVHDLLKELMKNDTEKDTENSLVKHTEEGRTFITDLLFDKKFIRRVKKFTKKYIFKAGSGRLFFIKGFKKLMWPIFIGVQVAKTVLLFMFLPSILGSLGKMFGKAFGFGKPAETVDDFEFKDTPMVDEPAIGIGYNYPQPQITADSASPATSFDTASAANNMLSLYDNQEPKPHFTVADTYSIPDYPASAQKATLQSKKDDFEVFHDIPASSMLFTNYDPFYSPLLSRLDSVFQQLNLNGDNEICREKIICLMYASPTKYMPYSNLVSAQLSRELNELRKPTTDNVEILRFFKYMRAARDGQDGKNCHSIYKKCSTITDAEQPAMLTTYNDINKLVHARKLVD